MIRGENPNPLQRQAMDTSLVYLRLSPCDKSTKRADKNRLHHGLAQGCAPPPSGGVGALWLQRESEPFFLFFLYRMKAKTGTKKKFAECCCFIIYEITIQRTYLFSLLCSWGEDYDDPDSAVTALSGFRDVSEQAPLLLA